MADPVPPATPTLTPSPEANHPWPRGYFNQAQSDGLETVENVLAAAQEHAADMAPRVITAEYITGFVTAIDSARDKTNQTGQATD